MEGRSNISPLLGFRAVWEKCVAKPFDFVKAMNHTSLEELESLRVLCAIRTDALENRNLFAEKLGDHVDKLETYLFHLSDLKAKSDTYWTKKTEQQLRFQWISPLADNASYVQLRGIDLEHGMVMFLYGCSKREEVHSKVAEMLQMESNRAGSAIECAKALKATAGIFKYLHTTLSENLQTENPAQLPAELVPAMSECFERICLGEAQALVAFRALEKSVSPSVISALHRGASDLFEQASSVLRTNTGKFNNVTEQLRRFIALSSSLEQIRAYQQAAAVQHANGECGIAVGYCDKALDLLDACQVVAETETEWLRIVASEQGFQTSLKSTFDVDRVNVYYQPVAEQLPRLSEGKILVETLEFEPLKKQPFL